MPIEDEDLAAAAMQGDERAFETLFIKYYPSLHRYVDRLIGSRYLAEDLVQDVFLRFLRQRSYRPTRPFKPWLFAVTTNAVRDYLRASSRRPPSEPLEAEIMTTAPDPGEVASSRIASAQLSALLQELPLEYRETIALRLFADLALDQIGETLAIPVGTVKSRLSVGLKRLRTLLATASRKEGS